MQKICIVIPCFNEEKRFPVREFTSFIDCNSEYYFCLVNDGSSDNTLKVLSDIQNYGKERILVVDLNINNGKAEAVRKGILKSMEWRPFDFVAYFDADFSTPLSELNNFLSYSDNYSFIIGSRIKRMGVVIERSQLRHYLGRLFSTVASIMLKLPVYDTQCGAKMISTKIAPIVFKEKFLSRWLFDIEIFARLNVIYGNEKVKEMVYELPLTIWIEKENSKIKPGYFIKVPFELIRIYNKYK